MPTPKAPYEIARSIAAEGRMLGYRGCQVLAFVETRIEATGSPPTYAEICDELAFLSIADVGKVLRRLEARNLLKRPGSRFGQIRIVREA